MLNKFGGNMFAAADAYNAGPNSAAVRRYAASADPRTLLAETQRYVALLGQLTQNRQQAGALPLANVPLPQVRLPPSLPSTQKPSPTGLTLTRAASYGSAMPAKLGQRRRLRQTQRRRHSECRWTCGCGLKNLVPKARRSQRGRLRASGLSGR
jgi:hypothetical protein